MALDASSIVVDDIGVKVITQIILRRTHKTLFSVTTHLFSEFAIAILNIKVSSSFRSTDLFSVDSFFFSTSING